MIARASQQTIHDLWSAWGMPIVSVGRHYWPKDVEGLVVEERKALVTWAVDGDTAEIVTLDAFEQNRGFGTALLAEAERILAERGVRLVRLMTTNDNGHALRFYIRRGYRIVEVHKDAMDEVYRLKPEAPRTGNDGIELRDLIELHKPLARDV